MWQTKKFGDICNFVRGPFGGSLKKSIFKADGFAVYEQQHAIYDQFSEIRYFVDKNKFNEMKRFELKSGDLIMSCSGTMGKIAIVPEGIKQGIINQALLKLTPLKSVDRYFLKYWMTSPNFQDEIERLSQGAAIKNVASVKVLKDIQAPLPSLDEQKQIVEILDEAFAGIDQAIANTEKNLQNTRDLFESYLNNIFTKKGDGWAEKPLVDITSKLGDGLHGTPKYTEDGEYYFINGNNLNNGQIEFKEKTKKVSEEEFHKYKKDLTDRTVLVSINGTLGKVAFYDNESVILGKSACYFNLREDIDKQFIKHLISSPYFIKYAHKEATGATIKNVSLKTMRSLIVPLPSQREQQKISKKLDKLEKQSQSLEAIYQQKFTALKELKQSLLQKAFAGDLTSDLREVA